MKNKVYIVILNYKGHFDTIECLESCLKLNYPNFEIVVIDNSPTNESINYLVNWANGNINEIKTSFEDMLLPFAKKPIEINFLEEDQIHTIKPKSGNRITLIKANNNKGFAAGNNVGLKFVQQKADYDFIWFLNNDTVIHPESLTNLVNFRKIKKEEKVGIIGSTLLYYSNPRKIQALGGLFNKWFATSKHLADGASISELAKIDTSKVDYVVGAAMFVSKEFLEDVGPMYEGYFLYYEEIDWIKRGLKKEWKIYICKESFVYHKEGASIGTGKPLVRSEFSDLLCLKNRIKFTKRFDKRFLPSVYAGFLVVLINRVRRKQYKRAIKVIKIMFGADKINNEN